MDDFTRKESRYILIMAKHLIAEPLLVSDEELEDEAQINAEIEAAKIKPGAMVTVIPSTLEGIASLLVSRSLNFLVNLPVSFNRIYPSRVLYLLI